MRIEYIIDYLEGVKEKAGRSIEKYGFFEEGANRNSVLKDVVDVKKAFDRGGEVAIYELSENILKMLYKYYEEVEK